MDPGDQCVGRDHVRRTGTLIELIFNLFLSLLNRNLRYNPSRFFGLANCYPLSEEENENGRMAYKCHPPMALTCFRGYAAACLYTS